MGEDIKHLEGQELKQLCEKIWQHPKILNAVRTNIFSWERRTENFFEMSGGIYYGPGKKR